MSPVFELVDQLPIWGLAAAIFMLRATDVTFGTMRILALIRGHKSLAAGLGFLEVLVWLAAVSQVLWKVKDHPVLILAYAGGFAAGNVIGMTLEQRLSTGWSAILMISPQKGEQIAAQLRKKGHRLTTLSGQGKDGPRTVLYATASRRSMPGIISVARDIDPQVFYSVDHCSETSYLTVLDRPALGWRQFWKHK